MDKIFSVVLVLLFVGCFSLFIGKCNKKNDSLDGLSFDSLKLSSHTVSGYFKENDLIEDDIYEWTGTSFVIYKKDNKLCLVTNSHCLSLAELAKSDDDTDATAEVNKYQLNITFASGKEAPVLEFGDQIGSLDLALLLVDATGLVEGRDYIIVPFEANLNISIGEEVVAVGSPKGLAGTHTFGRISAIRNFDGDEPYRAIQIDAAINSGNSGGPLFVKQGKVYKWIGVNTFTIKESTNLGFAIDAKYVLDSKYDWNTASALGAVYAIRKNYKRQAYIE